MQYVYARKALAAAQAAGRAIPRRGPARPTRESPLTRAATFLNVPLRISANPCESLRISANLCESAPRCASVRLGAARCAARQQSTRAHTACTTARRAMAEILKRSTDPLPITTIAADGRQSAEVASGEAPVHPGAPLRGPLLGAPARGPQSAADRDCWRAQRRAGPHRTSLWQGPPPRRPRSLWDQPACRGARRLDRLRRLAGQHRTGGRRFRKGSPPQASSCGGLMRSRCSSLLFEWTQTSRRASSE